MEGRSRRKSTVEGLLSDTSVSPSARVFPDQRPIPFTRQTINETHRSVKQELTIYSPSPNYPQIMQIFADILIFLLICGHLRTKKCYPLSNCFKCASTAANCSVNSANRCRDCSTTPGLARVMKLALL